MISATVISAGKHEIKLDGVYQRATVESEGVCV